MRQLISPLLIATFSTTAACFYPNKTYMPYVEPDWTDDAVEAELERIETGGATLFGIVCSENWPWPGVIVEVSNRNGIESTVSNVDGFYVITNLVPGIYRLRMQMPGLETAIHDIELFEGRALRFDQIMIEAGPVEPIILNCW